MRIVLKIGDDTPLGRFIQRRMAATGLEQSTIARQILHEAMIADVSFAAHTPAAITPKDNDEPDDDAVLAGLLGDM